MVSGPYSALRHPLYASTALVALFALLSPGWLLVAAAFGLVAAYSALVRAPAEEAALGKAFGDEYRAYVRRTGALFPRLARERAAEGGAESAPLVAPPQAAGGR